MAEHTFHISTQWPPLGEQQVTRDYKAYSRNHEIGGSNKAAVIPGSSDKAFRGDGTRYNPEELLVASLSTCHLLWMLHLCADAGVQITHYEDQASGQMRMNADGSGEFTQVTLRPVLTVATQEHADHLLNLHEKAHQLCFIARSVNFPVHHEAKVIVVNQSPVDATGSSK